MERQNEKVYIFPEKSLVTNEIFQWRASHYYQQETKYQASKKGVIAKLRSRSDDCMQTKHMQTSLMKYEKNPTKKREKHALSSAYLRPNP